MLTMRQTTRQSMQSHIQAGRVTPVNHSAPNTNHAPAHTSRPATPVNHPAPNTNHAPANVNHPAPNANHAPANVNHPAQPRPQAPAQQPHPLNNKRGCNSNHIPNNNRDRNHNNMLSHSHIIIQGLLNRMKNTDKILQLGINIKTLPGKRCGFPFLIRSDKCLYNVQ